MKTNAWIGRGLPLVLVALTGVVVWLNAARQGPPPPPAPAPTTLTCPDLSQGCAASLAGRDVRLGSDAAIRPLKPFQLWVMAPGAGKVEARFSMEGMNMGFNLYTLRQDREGVFRTSVTLPVCVSGRREWTLLLEVDGAGLAVPFVTDL